jgi:hypothetical protein
MHGNITFLCSYLYLKLAKMSCFSFSLFSSAKSKNRRAEQVLPRGRDGTCGRGKVAEKGGWRVNMVQKCVHMHVNAKMIHVETIP